MLQRTVVSPFAGGPIYQWLRAGSITLRRDYIRRPGRWIERNWDMERLFAVGTPPLHLDPNKNGWRYYVDSSYYAGMIDKTFEDSIRSLWAYPLIAMLIFYQHKELKEQDKYSFISKWRS